MTCEACLDAACSADGRITQRKDWRSGEEVEYQYDSLQRLSAAATNSITKTGMSFDADVNLRATPGLTMTSWSSEIGDSSPASFFLSVLNNLR